ncbi:beta-methylgalactoside transporter permease, partial [Blautia wexlerae]|nr:beta-methylgalactoside transporter permease [Blautia wexlerae]
MQEGKIVQRKSFALAFVGTGAVLAVLGIILNFVLDATKTFDLPWFVLGIGLAAVLYGVLQLTKGNRLTSTVSFSGKTAKRFLTNNAIMLALMVLIVVICFLEPRFMQIQVLLDILTQSSTRLIIALGICFALLIAGTDLSAGRMVGLAAVISTSMLQTATYANRFYPDLPQIPVFIPIIAAIAACMLFGALNGFLVAKYDMHPFIATLAVQVMIYG